MMRVLALLLLAASAGCTRPEHPHPLVPRDTQYSGGSSLSAGAGMMAAAIGANTAQRTDASPTSKAAGYSAMGAGVAMMAASLLDAVEVQKNREKFFNLMRAFNHQYSYFAPLKENEREALPPLPEVPFNFKDDDASDEDP